MTERSPREVLEDHLALRRRGDLEADLRRNYADDVVLLTGFGTFHGHDGVRRSARKLDEELPGSDYRYHTCLVDGEVGFLEWSGESSATRALDGADSYLIRGGRIVVQTIHYRVVEK